ncbi:MAG: alpha/beta hydrolase [Burkholderiales bacterium]|jgi:alpha/beta superfamily hydrolase|nr:alpha/beta hydrolase [Burkholderiales bacterium]
MTPKTLTRVTVQGSAGHIETVINTPRAPHAPCGIALIAAPNPQQGGTLDNKIVTTLAKSYFSQNFIVARFNYRGTGASEGAWDNGVGELDDARAVWRYLLSLYHGNLPPITALGGFSFGCAIQSQLALDIHPDIMTLIAPAAKRFALAHVPPETLVVHGDDDDVIPFADALAWARPQRLPMVVMPDCGHFFHGRLPDLQKVVTRFILARLAEISTRLPPNSV